MTRSVGMIVLSAILIFPVAGGAQQITASIESQPTYYVAMLSWTNRLIYRGAAHLVACTTEQAQTCQKVSDTCGAAC